MLHGWLTRARLLGLLAFFNPLRNPAITVVAVLTFLEEVGQGDAWYIIAWYALLNYLAVQLLCLLALQTVGNRSLWYWLLVARHHPHPVPSPRARSARWPFPFPGRERTGRTDWIWHRGNWRATVYVPPAPGTAAPSPPSTFPAELPARASDPEHALEGRDFRRAAAWPRPSRAS